MGFKDLSWSARFAAMGDEAENKFVEWADDNGVKHLQFGLNRPDLDVAKLPHRIRFAPDFLTNKTFVEVKGVGRDQLLKLKVSQHGALHWWADVFPVQLFVWDRTNERMALIDLADYDALVDDGVAELDRFPEGRAYFALPLEDIMRIAQV